MYLRIILMPTDLQYAYTVRGSGTSSGGGNMCIWGCTGEECMWESLSIYGRWLQSPRWLLPKVAQPHRPPRVPRLPPELDNNLGLGTLLPPMMLSNKHHGYNGSPKSTHHINSLSTSNSLARLHPPPWPNKKLNKYHNKYHYGTHILAGTTAKQQ